MMKHLIPSAAVAALALSAAPAFAQDDTTLMIETHEEYGDYLTDQDGRALYLFTDDRQGEGSAIAEVSCTADCLEAWPPLYTMGGVQPWDGVDEALTSTIDHADARMVTYNGWPLYYFTNDEEPGDVRGHGVNDAWYLVSPEGDALDAE